MKFLLLVAIVSTVAYGKESTANKSKRQVEYPHSNYPGSNNPPSSQYYNPLYYPPQCKPLRTCASSSSFTLVDVSWMLATPRLFYITAGGCTGYSHTANILLGRPVRTVQEENEMCLTYFLAGDDVYVDGYGNQFILYCYTMADGGRNCTAVEADPETDTSILHSEQCYPIYTDGVSFTVYVRCYNNKMDMIVLSTQPWLEEDDVTQVLNAAEVVQYPINDLVFLPCNKAMYPHPFQNYLLQSGPYNPNTCYADAGSLPPYSNYPPPPEPSPPAEPYNPPPKYNKPGHTYH